MLIFFNLSSTYIHIELFKYLSRSIARRNGWFITDESEKADLMIQIGEPNQPQIQIQRQDKLFLQLHPQHLTKIRKFLECEDTRSPDEEPSPIEKPLMDTLCDEIHQNICSYCRKNKIPFLYRSQWPDGKPLAISISHDIDLTRKYGVKFFLSEFGKGHLHNSKRLILDFLQKKNEYWNFSELLDQYRKKGIKSSFFFLSKPWERLNYRYNIQTVKFKNLFRDIQVAGHEIGLHSSRFAFDKPNKYEKQRKKLEKIIGRRVAGVRQHFLRVKFPIGWRYFENSGFQYDSSCGYNNAIGFRAGTCLPFQTFDFEKNKTNALYEIPFCIMDYPWITNGKQFDDNWKRYLNIFRITQEYNGLLNILWHPNNLAETLFRPYWDEMLEWFDGINFYQGTLHEIFQWIKKAQGVKLMNVTPSTDGLTFNLNSPCSIKDLTLRLISSHPLVDNQNDIKIKKVDDFDYQLILGNIVEGNNQFQLKYLSNSP